MFKCTDVTTSRHEHINMLLYANHHHHQQFNLVIFSYLVTDVEVIRYSNIILLQKFSTYAFVIAIIIVIPRSHITFRIVRHVKLNSIRIKNL